MGIRKKLGVHPGRNCSPPRCRLAAVRLTSYPPWTTRDFQCHKKKELKQPAAHLADLRSTDQARLANIGSAHLAQTSQPDPPTFGLSFSTMGVFLVEAAASSTISGSTPPNLSAKPAAPETPSLQLGSVPSETSRQNRRMPEEAFGAFMATTTALSAASFCSGDSCDVGG